MHFRCTLILIRSISFVALATAAADTILFLRVSNLRFYLGPRRQTFFVPTTGQAFTSRAGGNGIYRTLSPVRSSRPQRLPEKRPSGQKQATVTRSRFGRINQPRPGAVIPRRRKGKRPCRHLLKVEGRSVGPHLLPGSPVRCAGRRSDGFWSRARCCPMGSRSAGICRRAVQERRGFEVPAVPGAFSRVG
jgi:hypothetical protein